MKYKLYSMKLDIDFGTKHKVIYDIYNIYNIYPQVQSCGSSRDYSHCSPEKQSCILQHSAMCHCYRYHELLQGDTHGKDIQHLYGFLV